MQGDSVESRQLSSMTNAELVVIKKNAKAQVIKLQQALESLNQSAIQHSLKSVPPGSTDVTTSTSGADHSFTFVPRTSTTEERIQDAKQYIGAIALMLHDAEQQRDAVIAEEQRRSDAKRLRVATTQAESATNLDGQIKKDVQRHLSNAQSMQYDTLQGIQEGNRRHQNKVAAIRKAVEEQRAEQLSNMKLQEKKEHERNEQRQSQLRSEAEQRRERNDAKEAKLSEKLAAFDKARMKSLESGPREAGHLVRELQSTQSAAIKAESRRHHKAQYAQQQSSTGASKPAVDPYSAGVMDRLTKLPPRGIGIKNDFDSSLENHVAQAQRMLAYTSVECKDRREKSEKRHDKNFDELYDKKERKWAEKAHQQRSDEQRINTLKSAQMEQLSRLTSQREEIRTQAYIKAQQRAALGTVDHWAARARRLLESACVSAIQLQDGGSRRGGAASSLDHQRRPQEGFEGRSKTPF
ncbi:Hypothetical protein, putative [Bodo saltans]|uniref:Uncharacterized protein n=1 Tax=Bodo saltans TaxID=75058 RepID=A0A0S4KEY0_BODSA|nr:Hypothetical protein, putative [Bodo saltans]|eukprot:CUI14150.1 Hypothetical protein, putative [Bodo saltans]